MKYFENEGIMLFERNGNLTDGKIKFPVKDGIPRFTPDKSYSTGNFSKLREKHSKLQLDSYNDTNDRLNTILNRTNWPATHFSGKTILECGCGAGPDTEILLNLGAKIVAVDIAGLDIAKKNLTKNPSFNNVQFVQDSITNLHLRPRSFDIVFCHRVIQHTPEPEKTLKHILKFVKTQGDVFVHSYSNSRYQMWRWKYFLLPLTRRIHSELLYNIIKLYSWPIFYLTCITECFKLGNMLNHIFIPFLNYRKQKKFKGKNNKFIVEYGIHDTFDALSPKFDKPISPEKMTKIAKKYLKRDFEIVKDPSMILLRTIK